MCLTASLLVSPITVLQRLRRTVPSSPIMYGRALFWSFRTIKKIDWPQPRGERWRYIFSPMLPQNQMRTLMLMTSILAKYFQIRKDRSKPERRRLDTAAQNTFLPPQLLSSAYSAVPNWFWKTSGKAWALGTWPGVAPFFILQPRPVGCAHRKYLHAGTVLEWWRRRSKWKRRWRRRIATT